MEFRTNYKYALDDALDAQLWNYEGLKEKATYVVRKSYGRKKYCVDRITKTTRLSGASFATPLEAQNYIREQQAKDIAEGKTL